MLTSLRNYTETLGESPSSMNKKIDVLQPTTVEYEFRERSLEGDGFPLWNGFKCSDGPCIDY